jgi:hypothetical protein
MDDEREWTADDEREVAAIIVRFLKATGSEAWLPPWSS